MIQATLLKPDNTIKDYPVSEHDDYGKAVEGWIEAVSLCQTRLPGPDISFIMWVNEEYMYKKDPLKDWNFLATSMAGMCGRPDLILQGVLGNALLTGPADLEGETTDLPNAISNLAVAIKTALASEIEL